MALRPIKLPFEGGIQNHPTLPAFSAGTAASERAARAADRARIFHINARIVELEAFLSALKEEKTSLQNRLDTYRYPVLTLPNEIVSEILVHFLPVYPKCPPPMGPLSPYLLCQICRKWRDIALATPALWRAFSLSLQKKKKRVAQALRLMELSLQRSGSCPLSIVLQRYGAESSKQARFVRAITKHCARWEHLTLYISEPLDALPGNDLPLPHLRTLRLGPNEEDPIANSTFLAAPLLQKVEFSAYRDAHGPLFPWSQLTVLLVHFISLKQFADIIHQLVSIVHCRLYIRANRNHEPSWRNATLSHLETLILEGHPREFMWYSRGVLDTLTLPALQRLHVPQGLIGPAAGVAAFLSRSGCSLDQLCIPDAGPAFRREYSAPLPSVTVIFTSGPPTITEPFLKRLTHNVNILDLETEPSEDEGSSNDIDYDDDSD
ncbi:hypothetical protein C8R47DRAFT_168656 [Mycena vitilis]|nr:hypothetical protein C8R47DRAFT_168656 [Mycena vitilis]